MNNRRTRGWTTGRSGAALAYIIVTLPAVMAFVSLAVDVGHVQMVKTQLRIAADAAARYASYGLSYNYTTARSWATVAAGNNTADGSTVVVDSDEDVDLGTWDPITRTFTELSGTSQSYANAVRVTACRTARKRNPVSLTFAPLIGMNTCDLTAQAIATYKPGGFGVVGLNYITMSGNTQDSYWSTSGAPSSFSNMGSILSNGNITITGSAKVYGNAFPGVGCSVSNPAAVTGLVIPLTTPASYPPKTVGTYATTNDNSNLGKNITSANDLTAAKNASLQFPPGNYYIHNLTVNAGATMYFTGATTLWVTGSINMSGHALAAGYSAGSLKINSVADTNGTLPGSISINVASGCVLGADIYAPQSDLSMGGTGDIYGSVVGKSITMSGTASIHYDLVSGGFGSVQLVQ